MPPHLDEREIMDYLMTSDFEEGLTREEFRFLLIKFRSYYRVAYGRNESRGREIESMSETITELKAKIDALTTQVVSERDMRIAEEGRKLTWTERLTGRKKEKK
jgi:hypothetical protein